MNKKTAAETLEDLLNQWGDAKETVRRNNPDRSEEQVKNAVGNAFMRAMDDCIKNP